MDLENEIFQKCTILFDKLLPFGFQKEKKEYVITKNILEDTFQLEVRISESGSVKAKVYDLAFEEEYTNYRISEQTGKFVNQIREELEKFLLDIKKHCTATKYFITDQANRITNLLFEKYHDLPEFPWEKLPDSGVFRNPINQKWYGLIMDINQNKLGESDKLVEILNLKLPENLIPILLKRKGFYKAYHMNKEKWITILLDNTLSDEEIMEYLAESHQFTEPKRDWLIPANPKYYDVIHCFDYTDIIFWKQPSTMQKKDQVYLYVGSPYSAILYQCEVVETEIPYSYQDQHLSMQKVMKLKLLHRFQAEQLPLEKLKKYGVKSIRGPRSLPKKLLTEINQILKKNEKTRK